MLQELISKAKQIEDTTDANIGGASAQVVKNLTLDEVEQIFNEVYDNEKHLKRAMKRINRVRQGNSSFETIDTLRDTVSQMVFNRAR